MLLACVAIPLFSTKERKYIFEDLNIIFKFLVVSGYYRLYSLTNICEF